jgi:hypothetical protein
VLDEPHAGDQPERAGIDARSCGNQHIGIVGTARQLLIRMCLHRVEIDPTGQQRAQLFADKCRRKIKSYFGHLIHSRSFCARDGTLDSRLR